MHQINLKIIFILPNVLLGNLRISSGTGTFANGQDSEPEIHFIMNPESDQHGYRHARSEARNVDERINFVSREVPPGDFKEMPDHAYGIDGVTKVQRKCQRL